MLKFRVREESLMHKGKRACTPNMLSKPQKALWKYLLDPKTCPNLSTIEIAFA